MKKNSASWLLTLSFLFIGLHNKGQEQAKKWQLNGYVKNLSTFSLGGDTLLFDNLIHNRLNFAYYHSPAFSTIVEFRNRIATGDQLNFGDAYKQSLDANQDFFDLSALIIDNEDLLFHVMLDRAYLQYDKNNWEVKVGRQRINWGINLAWNPNDIFNAYSYFDFDYEERPGSDAVRVKKYYGYASSIEIASKITDDSDKLTAAGMWKFNKWNYDFQVLSGVAAQNIVTGAGWAGNIKNAGFKGESTFYYPFENNPDTTKLALTSVTIDYSFPNSLYLNASVLHNSDGSLSPSQEDLIRYYGGVISSKLLSPYRWSSFLQGAYQFHPLVYGGLAFIAFPGSYDFFFNPFLTLSAKQNFDIDLISQIVMGKSDDKLRVAAQQYYLRFKWSF